MKNKKGLNIFINVLQEKIIITGLKFTFLQKLSILFTNENTKFNFSNYKIINNIKNTKCLRCDIEIPNSNYCENCNKIRKFLKEYL